MDRVRCGPSLIYIRVYLFVYLWMGSQLSCGLSLTSLSFPMTCDGIFSASWVPVVLGSGGSGRFSAPWIPLVLGSGGGSWFSGSVCSPC